jgi:two-component system sensor histidine kinase QseC
MSIRRYLVLILISIITLITFFAAIQGYKASMQKAAELFDAQLRAVAMTLISIEAKQNILTVDSQEALAFQIWQNQQLILATSNVPTKQITEFKEGFSVNNFSRMRWRVYAHNLPEQQKWILVAQPIKPRFELAEKVILSAVMPIVLAIPLLSLIISLIVRQGLKPLTQLTEQLTNKKINALNPLKMKQSSAELVPVVDTLNHLFQQLDAAFTREKRFAADAAHELRTPLSVLKINCHNLQYEQNNNGAALSHLVASVDRMAHVIDQILLLNKTNPEQFSEALVRLNLTTIAQQVIAALYPEINARQQQISLQAEDSFMAGNEFAIATLLQNLIANACKYTPEKGQILVTIEVSSGQVRLMVEDSGPGIATSELDKVFDRFYRVGGDRHNSTTVGCGLGLPIVKHIVQLHNGQISLARSSKLKGLKVTVIFPTLVNNTHG